MPALLVVNTVFLDDDGTKIPVEILVTGGKIARIEAPGVIGVHDSAVFDADGAAVFPGVIDGHVHMRKGQEHKEEMRTLLASAYAGGVTTIGEMPNSLPNITTVAIMESVLAANDKAGAPVITHAGATPGNAEDLRKMIRLKNVRAVKVVRCETTGDLLVPDDDPFERILGVTEDENVVTLIHTGEQRLVDQNKSAHKEQHAACTACCHGSIQSPDVEIQGGIRDIGILMRRRHTAPVIICHVSTPRLMMEIKRAREAGFTNIHAEVTGHHLSSNDGLTEGPEGNFSKVNPPLRSEPDRLGLEEAVVNGHAEILGSDHAPHSLEEKSAEYAKAPSGISGLQTNFAVLIDLMIRGRLKPSQVRAMTSGNPARIFGLTDRGEVATGKRADLVFVKMDQDWLVKRVEAYTKAGRLPLEGRTLRGMVSATMLNGRVVYERGVA